MEVDAGARGPGLAVVVCGRRWDLAGAEESPMSTSTFQRQIIATPDAPEAIGTYSQAVLVNGGRTLY